MMRKPHWTILFTVMSVIALDQWSKWWLLEIVGMATRRPVVITDFFSLVMVWNKGVSFGILNGEHSMPYALVAMAVAVSGLLLRLALKSPSCMERIGFALVIGGALGNVVDRLRFGAVADFFYFHLGDLSWPAFNVADSAICIGVIGLLIRMIRAPKTSGD